METKKYKLFLSNAVVILTIIFLAGSLQAQQLAFPTAEGYGKNTTGGRGGKIYIVTNLNNSGSGSLREAIDASGKRTVVFRVSGIIKLESDLNLKNGDISILGQTAPGEGICIANYSLVLNASNVIIRYMRFRPGSFQPGEYDACWGRNKSNIILDHCSFSWGNDEQASFYDNTSFTMQYCIISESFYSSTHPKGNHGFGGIWGGMGATFHHNLIVNHTSRTPRFCGARYHLTTASTEKVDFRNNVIFNWGYNNVYGGESGNHNIVNNYYKPGPATGTGKVKYRIVNPSDSKSSGNPISKWYVSGNYVDGNTAVTSDNWNGGVQQDDAAIALSELKLNSPLSGVNINTQSAADAYTKVLATAGASLKRDAVDARAVNSVKTGITNYGGVYGANKGIIDNETQVGGYPTYASATAPADTDKDGIPDAWESSHGLNTTVADQNGDRDGDGYTNIEEYAGCLVGEFSDCNPAADCNGVTNGTAKLDNCGRCTGGNTGKTACASVGEAETDACVFDGTVDNDNAGFKGTGFINVPNEIGSRITFSLNAAAAGNYVVSFRYASGGAADRAATIMLDGSALSNVLSFPVTGAFTTYKTVDLTLNLSRGLHTLELVSSTANGLANIDQIGYVSTGIVKGECLITGFSPEAAESGTAVYPNPFNENLVIEQKGNFTYRIFTADGQELETGHAEDKAVTGEKLPAGIYILKTYGIQGAGNFKITRTQQ